jgi:hypothetical protein
LRSAILGHQAQAGEEVDVLLDGQVGVEVLAQALRHQADAVLDALGRGVAVQRGAEDLQRALLEAQHAGRGLHQAGLARAVRPDQAEDLAAPHFQVQALHRLGLAIALAKALRPQHQRRGGGISGHGAAHQRGCCQATPSFQRTTASAGTPGVRRCSGFWSR